MTNWLESYRGVVKAWECDVVAHFTIAYYFDRFAEATRTFLETINCGEQTGMGLAHGPVRRVATFQHELRAGAAFHIVSGVTGIGETMLQLGHQVVDTASGKTVTWLHETIPMTTAVPSGIRGQLAAALVSWNGPALAEAPARQDRVGMLTTRDRVKPKEIDEDGCLTLSDHVHRFSAASSQALTAIGLGAAYMQQQRRGFSTFELDFTQSDKVGVGERLDITTSVASLGKSSLRFAHRMTGADGREIATLIQSGVHLDMDLRRSTAIPDELRPAILKLVSKP